MSNEQNQLIPTDKPQIGELPITNFQTLYNLLLKIDFEQQDEILNLEKQLYRLIKENPNDINGLILLMQEQIMVGQQQKAKALAYKIWDLGGEMSLATEALFIGNLINVGLCDMASILLKPKFDNLKEYINTFFPQLIKYAIASGNLNFLEKIAVLDANFERKKALQEFVNVFKYLNAEEHLKALQKTLMNMIKDLILCFDFNIYTDRGFTDIEIIVYVGDEAGDREILRNKLEMQITAYCAAKSLPRFNNLSYIVRNIKEHPALEENLARG